MTSKGRKKEPGKLAVRIICIVLANKARKEVAE